MQEAKCSLEKELSKKSKVQREYRQFFLSSDRSHTSAAEMHLRGLVSLPFPREENSDSDGAKNVPPSQSFVLSFVLGEVQDDWMRKEIGTGLFSPDQCSEKSQKLRDIRESLQF